MAATFDDAVKPDIDPAQDVDKPADESDEPLSSALLVEAAEIENRLRKHVLELLEPTIRKQTIMEVKMRELRSAVDRNAEDLQAAQRSQEGAAHLYTMVDEFRKEMAQWNEDRVGHQQAIGDRVSHQELEINVLRQSIENKAGEGAIINRSLKKLSELIATAQEDTSELRKYCSDRLDVTRDKVAKLQEDFEIRGLTIDTEQLRLKDSQIRTDTVLKHMDGVVERMSRSIKEVVSSIEDLHRVKASVNIVEQQQKEFSVYAKENNVQISSLREQFDEIVTSIKAHFDTATQVVGTSTAKQMEEVRSQYQDEAKKVHSVVHEVNDMMRRQSSAIAELKSECAGLISNIAQDMDSLRLTFEGQHKEQKNEACNLSMEVAQIKKNCKTLQGQDQAGHLRTEILSMIVEAQMLDAALDLQDDIDRKTISLFGYKSVSEPREKPGILPDLDNHRSVSMKTPRKKSSSAPGRDTGGAAAVLSMDTRCVSCSGSNTTALAGFKLACLQYNPTPIEYQRVSYTRGELIRKRMELLGLAKDQMRSLE